jgi:hypothetical protein
LARGTAATAGTIAISVDAALVQPSLRDENVRVLESRHGAVGGMRPEDRLETRTSVTIGL